ncbi:BTAD domain-containing putative transcriptional regulator [Cryptosporangium sp. NPDC051539]|uniref:BTAD domain-containing putative transcriptional regulator n=1 Tax=Cryptosporangium sp. NPDC051539 TaxID=3363962 RepID=UPI00379B55CB
MRIRLLGPLELRDASDRPVPVTGVRQRALLCRLALDPGRLVTVDRLIDDLWGARAPSSPANALQSAVSRLRRDLDRAGPPGRDTIRSHPAGYRLDLSPGHVDLHECARLAAAGTAALRSGDADAAARLLREALALWHGPALADAVGAPFAPVAAERAEALRRATLEARVDADLTRGADATGLVDELTAACAADPLAEGLAARLVRALTADGRRAEALRRYDAVRRTLADELGVDPGAELRAAHLAALQDDGPARPDVAGRAGDRRPAPVRRGALPAALTSLVGREHELERLASLLASERLVTLTGPGGAGKTRLALEAGAADPAPDGVWLIELAGLPPRAPAGAVAEAALAVLARPQLSRPELSWPGPVTEPDADPVARLGELLGGRRLLLVLDNAEHVADAVAGVVTAVLAAAPGVRALVTSREPLGVVGEALGPVGPLPVDTAGSAAVRLFAERAAAVRPGFVLTDDTAAHVVRICRALDGLPLAIELAAARLRSLSLREVASRLDDRLALLGRGSRGGVPRHRTLRAVLDGSWELLSSPERVLLRRLAIFAGAPSLEGVDAVCGAGLPGDELLDLVGDLVDRSLLVPVDGPDGRRYRLLETVREYAAERLDEAGERDLLAAAHTAYVLDVAERTEPQLRTAGQLVAIARFQAWHADLDAAGTRALAAGELRAARRLVAARTWFWWLTGQRRAAGAWAEQALAGWDGHTLDDTIGLCVLSAAATARRPLETPWALSPSLLEGLQELRHPVGVFAAAWLAGTGEQLDEGRRKARMLVAAERFAGHADPWCRAASALLAGHAAWDAGDTAGATAAFAAARDGFATIGERWGMLLSLSSVAMATTVRDPRAALQALLEAERMAEELDGLSEVPELLVQIATLAGRLGEQARAAGALDRAEALVEQSGDPLLAARIRHARGEVARHAGDLDLAAAELYTALKVLEAVPGGAPASTRFSAQLLSCLGRVEAERGSAAAAGRHAEALGRAGLTGDAPLRADVLERFAAWCATSPSGDARVQARRGARALGAAWALRHPGARHPGATPEGVTAEGASPDAAVAREGCRAVLGDTGFDRYWRAGTALDEPERMLAP